MRSDNHTSDDSQKQGATASHRKSAGIDRRTFLKGAAAVASVAVLGPSMAACGDGSTNNTLSPVRRDGSSPLDYIDNVVILQMENRSFDHYFASLAMDEGRTDVTAMKLGAANPDTNGDPVPINWLDDDYIMYPDPGHTWEEVHRQWNNGACDGFVQEWQSVLAAKDPENAEKYLHRIMGYYQREQLPILYTLSDHFTLCDHWFSAILGPTWPNRFYSMAGTSGGWKENLHPLEKKFPTPYGYMIDQKGLTVKNYALNTSYYFGMMVKDLALHVGGAESIKGFYSDCENGTLPNVSIVEPNYGFNDDHPPHDVKLGQAFISSVYEAVRKSPQYERTLMLVYYDEHGGIHDHLEPPKPKGEPLEDFAKSMGFRVPGMLIGPLVKPGFVLNDVVEHSSVPSLISRLFGVDQVTDRAAQSGTFKNAFDMERIDGTKREAPPSMEKVVIPHAKVRAALQAPFGQPELMEYSHRVHGTELPTYSDQLREAEDHLRQLERMGIARVTD